MENRIIFDADTSVHAQDDIVYTLTSGNNAWEYREVPGLPREERRVHIAAGVVGLIIRNDQQSVVESYYTARQVPPPLNWGIIAESYQE